MPEYHEYVMRDGSLFFGTFDDAVAEVARLKERTDLRLMRWTMRCPACQGKGTTWRRRHCAPCSGTGRVTARDFHDHELREE